MNSSSQSFITPTSAPQGNRNSQNRNQQNTGSNGSSSSSFVQRNSVQNQFAVLSADRDKFSREIEEANKELKQTKTEHQSVKIEHDTLIEHGRQAKAKLGERMERSAILKERKTRIIQMTENESLAIHDCTNHSKMLDMKKDEATKKYIAEMDTLNEDTAKFIQARIEKNTEQCISVRSVEAVVLPAFDKALRDNDKPQLSNQTQNLHQSIEILKFSTAQRNEIIARLRELHCMLQESGTNVGDDDDQAMMIRLAREERGSADTNDHYNQGPKHMDLFYGPSKLEEEVDVQAVENAEYMMMTE